MKCAHFAGMSRVAIAVVMVGCSRHEVPPATPATLEKMPTAEPQPQPLPQPILLGAPIIRRPSRPGTNVYGEPTYGASPAISALATDGAGAFLVTVDDQMPGGAILWDRLAARELAVFGDRVTHAVAMSRDGARVATVDASARLRVWDRARHVQLRELALANGLAIGFSPGGDRVIGVGRDVTLVLDMNTGATWEMRHAVPARIATIAASGDRVALAAGNDVQVLTIVGRSFEPLRLTAVEPVTVLSLSPDGRALGVGGRSGVQLYDAVQGSTLSTATAVRGEVLALAMISPTSYVSATPYLEVIRGQQARRLWGHGGPATTAALFAGGGLVAVGNTHGTVHVWNLETRLEVRAAKSHAGRIEHLTFVSSEEILSSGPWDTREYGTRNWQVLTRTSRGVVTDGQLYVSATVAPIHLVAASPDARFLLYRTISGLIVRGHEGHEWVIPQSWVNADTTSAFSTNGRWLVFGMDDGSVIRIEVERIPDPAAMVRWEAHDGQVEPVAISDDGDTILSGCRETKIWRMSGASPRLVREHTDLNAVYMPDGSDRLVVADDFGTIEVQDLATGERVMTLQPGARARLGWRIGAFSRDRRVFAMGDGTGLVQLWDLTSGARIGELPRHPTSITALAFSPDGARLATGDDDGVIRIWPVPGTPSAPR